jgi:uncharacterized protein (TIGR00255 family)
MTGFGQAEVQRGTVRVRVTVRCGNHRFADLRLRLPPDYAPWEPDLRRAILGRLRRGRIEVDVAVERTEAPAGAVTVNRHLLAGVVEISRILREEFGIGGALDQKTVLSLPGLVVPSFGASVPAPEERAVVEEALGAAVEAADAARRGEGEALSRDLSERLALMEDLVAQLESRAASVPSAVRERLLEKVRALDPGRELDPTRLAQEVLFWAERADVSEELVRLRSHLGRARALLGESSGEPAGKRLDILLQEVQREANTLASKAADIEMSRLAVDLKIEAEKVREQAQNVE